MFEFLTHHGLRVYTNDRIEDYVKEKGLESEVLFIAKTTYNDAKVGHFRFSPMPGCCGVVVSHDTHVVPEWRGSGASRHFREIKDLVARELGYSCVVMTTQMHNVPAVKNMFNRGFKVAGTFNNKRTNNLLALGWKHV